MLLRDILYGVTEDDNEAPNNHNRKSRRDGNHAPLPGIQVPRVFASCLLHCPYSVVQLFVSKSFMGL